LGRQALYCLVDGFQSHVASGNRPFVILFSQDGTDRADNGIKIREDANHIGSAADLPVQPLLRVVRPYLSPVPLRENQESQQVRTDIGEKVRGLWKLSGEPLHDTIELAVYLFNVGQAEYVSYKDTYRQLGLLGHLVKQGAHEAGEPIKFCHKVTDEFIFESGLAPQRGRIWALEQVGLALRSLN
jgi:hypothetical protein